MGLLNQASAASAWRGYEYYENGNVKSCRKINDDEYEGQVAGSEGRSYQVKIRLAHPGTSQCSCPLAAGKRIVCKHKVALYFSAFPKEAEDYYQEVLEAEKRAEQAQEELERAVIRYVRRMKKADLQETLLQLLLDGPEWQFDRFVRQNYIEYDD